MPEFERHYRVHSTMSVGEFWGQRLLLRNISDGTGRRSDVYNADVLDEERTALFKLKLTNLI